MMTPTRAAVLYARVSTGGNSEDPAELAKQDPETQLRALREYAAHRGWHVEAEHHDRISGDPERRRKPGDPPGLRAALQAVQDAPRAAGKPVLLIFSAERLVRSPVHLIQTVSRIQGAPYSADVASLEDGRDLDTTDDAGELLLFLKGWFARMWLKLMRRGTREGLRRARAQGKLCNRPRAAIRAEDVLQARRAGLSWSATARTLGCSVKAARYAAASPLPKGGCQ